MHLSNSHCFLVIDFFEVLLYQLKEPFTGILATSLLYFVEIDHAVREVHNPEVCVRKVHFIEISHYI